MSDVRRLISESAERIFREGCDAECVEAAEQGTWPEQLWSALEESGLTLVAVPEELGGAGGSLGDALAVLRQAGRHAVPLPLAETFLAGHVLSQAGLKVGIGPMTVAPVRPDDRLRVHRDGDLWRLSGTARDVPWARQADKVVLAYDEHNRAHVAVIGEGECAIEPSCNLAGEPRDKVTFAGTALDAQRVTALNADAHDDELIRLGALARSVLMAGSLETVLALTVQHARERSQFGRPIGKFQAIQQQLAVLAGETAAAARATDLAIDAMERQGSRTEIAVAKARVGEAAGVCAEISHQLHGAIGFTREHELHCHTRRLWSWRDEFGHEVYWQQELGRAVAERGPAGLWTIIAQATTE